VADAMARFAGTLLAGVVRDVMAHLTGQDVLGYVWVFAIQAGLLVVSLVMLARIDVGRFRTQTQTNLAERATLMNDAG
jgi:BCD family chlorophyll transporter-like MFS transporter